MMLNERNIVVPGAYWRENNSTDTCENRLCGRKFSLLISKHHCRWCGKIFCGDCAPRNAVYRDQLLRRCNACRLPFFFRSLYNPATGQRTAFLARLIYSFLDRRTINSLLQSCYTAMSEFDVGDYPYFEFIQMRFPSFFEGARIGRGVSGAVYKCEDRSRAHNQRVALKVITKSSVLTFAAWCKITTELDILRDVDHPNVARLLEVFQTPLYLVIVMEAGEGGTLKQVWEFVRKYRYDMEVLVASVVSQISEGLDYLYREKGIVHRDIKHDNIVLSRDFSRTMIIDFGLAEYVNNGRLQSFIPCGTIGFASPENIYAAVEHMRHFEASGATMHRADMFSLGVVAYTLLCGKRPLDSKRYTEIYNEMRKGITCEGPRWANISDSAKSLVTWLLRTNANKRATPQNVRVHPFVLEKAPLITDIAKKRVEELSYMEQIEGDEWVYVASSGNCWDLATDKEFSDLHCVQRFNESPRQSAALKVGVTSQ